jgi:hypothetical protein
VKYVRLPQFNADYARLSSAERAKFKEMLHVFIPALKAYEADPAGYRAWPGSLRFEHLTSTKGVMAVTWSFSGPDGRATFHFKTVDDEIYLVWRRVGRHSIYRAP